MEDGKKTNVIQFPGGRRKDSEPVAETSVPAAPAAATKPQAKKKRSKKNAAGTVLAILLATGAVNRYAFSTAGQINLASESGGRKIASVDPASLQRDADWEKSVAESLASPHARDVASIQVGRAATPEEKLRWGTLEEKYTITFRQDVHEIESILLQNEAGSAPSYVLSRAQFLSDYGSLLSGSYSSFKLKSVQTVNGKTIEEYVLFGKDDKPQVEANFELDRHQRLLSLKVEPVQI